MMMIAKIYFLLNISIQMLLGPIALPGSFICVGSNGHVHLETAEHHAHECHKTFHGIQFYYSEQQLSVDCIDIPLDLKLSFFLLIKKVKWNHTFLSDIFNLPLNPKYPYLHFWTNSRQLFCVTEPT
jgi:hypothetical protein